MILAKREASFWWTSKFMQALKAVWACVIAGGHGWLPFIGYKISLTREISHRSRGSGRGERC